MSHSKDRLKKRFDERKSTRQMYAEHRAFQPIPLDTLRLDGGTQPRERFDEHVLNEYAERMLLDDRGFVVDPDNQEWEPIVAYEDDDTLWLADGFHRVRAARSAGLFTFQARVIIGSQRDAIKYSLSANARHGLRRSNADKRRAVERALLDTEWALMSTRALGELCSVSDFMVRQLRAELESCGQLSAQTERIGADGKLHDVSTRQLTPLARDHSADADAHANHQKKHNKKAPSLLGHAKPLASHLGATHLTFDTLDGSTTLPRVDCLLARPTSLIHFDALIDHIPRLITPHSTLLVILPQGGIAFTGPARLERLVEANTLGATRWIILQDTQQLLAVWSNPRKDLPALIPSLDALLTLLKPKKTALLTPAEASD